jgi:hypothetical protein
MAEAIRSREPRRIDGAALNGGRRYGAAPCPSRSARATAWRSARHPRRAAGRAASTLAIPSVSPSLPGEPDAPGPGATVRRLEIAASCRSIWPSQVRRDVVLIPNTKRFTHALISGRDNLLTQNQIHSGQGGTDVAACDDVVPSWPTMKRHHDWR